MSSREPATPGAADDDSQGAAASEVAADADTLALAKAEAEAAEATAAAARARAEVLRLQQDRDSTEVAASTEPAADQHDTTPVDPALNDADDSATTPVDKAGRFGLLGRVWKPLRWAAATLAVLAIGGLIAASVLMVLHHRDVEHRQRQAGEYLAAARQSVVTLMSLNFNTVDDDVQRILDNSTGDFKKDFEKQAEDFVDMAKQSQAVTEATATSAAIESMTDSDAMVLVAANTTVTNAGGAEDEPRNWRLSVKLVRAEDQIKMSNVEFVP
jgi:Mce-associated membrane protein